MNDHTPSRNGFTLIEVSVVIAVIGIMIFILAPMAINLTGDKTKETANLLKTIIERCYGDAIIQNHSVILHFDLEKQKFKTYKLVRDENGLDEITVIKDTDLPESARIVDITDDMGVKYTEGSIEIPFSYKGVAANYAIHLGEAYQIKETVMVYRYGGKVLVEAGEKNFQNQLKDSGEGSSDFFGVQGGSF